MILFLFLFLFLFLPHFGAVEMLFWGRGNVDLGQWKYHFGVVESHSVDLQRQQGHQRLEDMAE